jgi:uncharacterized membrane protein YeaQ/YmgE (transglycosylase-associated protein family)
MRELSPLGWIIIGLIGGWLSGMVVPGRQARGCLPNILIGILGGLVGGWLFRQLEIGDPSGFLGAVVVSFVGAVIVRVVVAAATDRSS